MTTLNLKEAAALLKIHPVTLQDKARADEIPGAKIGRAWVFIEIDLLEYIRSKCPRRALLRAGIAEFRWHDLRHTWASWHAQAGTPLHVLQELGAWECVEMVRKYAHLSTVHLADYVDRAVEIGLDPAVHRSLKARLAGDAWARTLGDSADFTRRFETVMQRVCLRG